MYIHLCDGRELNSTDTGAATLKIRREIDSLGPREVPDGAYYGIQTQRAIDNFPISGYRANAQLVRAIGMIKKAAAAANRELKLEDAKRAGAIAKAADEVND